MNGANPGTRWEDAWWAAAQERRLTVQRCFACGAFQHPPRSMCTTCAGSELELVEASGNAEIVSHTMVNRSVVAGLDPPYTVALVRLEEGPVMLTHLGGDAGDRRCGAPARLAWRQLADGRNLAMFEPEV